ncbi:MAG: hypothetical protein NTW04_02800 [Elusimicrobia bacterium]|nr:hypothetical protein [Elusimicrobiota bacterium]
MKNIILAVMFVFLAGQLSAQEDDVSVSTGAAKVSAKEVKETAKSKIVKKVSKKPSKKQAAKAKEPKRKTIVITGPAPKAQPQPEAEEAAPEESGPTEQEIADAKMYGYEIGGEAAPKKVEQSAQINFNEEFAKRGINPNMLTPQQRQAWIQRIAQEKYQEKQTQATKKARAVKESATAEEGGN